MRENLIKILFNHFEKDKEVIKQNLLKLMDEVVLECDNEYQKISLVIRIEKKRCCNESKEKVQL